MNEYTEGVDWEFLKAMGVTWVFHQAWQIGLFHPDLKGKFVWYPSKGTLMYEGEHSSHKVKNSGDFQGQDDTTEDVYNEIMNKITEQQQ